MQQKKSSVSFLVASIVDTDNRLYLPRMSENLAGLASASPPTALRGKLMPIGVPEFF